MEPTYDELKARLAELEKQNQTLRTKNAGHQPTLFVTEEDGLFEIRWLESQAVRLQASTVRWIVANAQTILPFITNNQHFLYLPTDSTEMGEEKKQNRQENLKSDNPVVRAKKDTSWRQQGSTDALIIDET